MGRVKYPLDFIIIFFLLHSQTIIRKDVRDKNGRKVATSSMFAFAASEDDEAAKKVRELFIADVKNLLEHNRVFYNTYGNKDADVDWAFDQAKIAADVIYIYPQIFREKIQSINAKIEAALKKKKEENDDDNVAVTADGVPVYFVDKGLLLIGGLGSVGMIRFPLGLL